MVKSTKKVGICIFLSYIMHMEKKKKEEDKNEWKKNIKLYMPSTTLIRIYF
jgi:hypothetical protein